MSDDRLDWPPRPAGLTEAELFRGYSGLVDRRQGRRRDPIVTVETVRAEYEAAAEDAPAVRPTSREEIRP
jgi:hypothetical protein